MKKIIPHLNKYLVTKHPYLNSKENQTLNELTSLVDQYLQKTENYITLKPETYRLSTEPQDKKTKLSTTAVINPKYLPLFIKLFEKISGNFSEFFKLQKDLPGINHLVRYGLVKEITLPENKKFILKKENPNKPGRFQQEQINISILKERFQKKLQTIKLKNRTIEIKIIDHIGYIQDHKNKLEYSITKHQPGPTLEEVLIKEKSPKKRQEIFQDIGEIFKTICNLGIYWGDMAPRNIIVNQSEQKNTYYLLDFEKTEIFDRELTPQEIENLCRGPMCIEEFGAVCSLEEVKSIFNPHFDPEKWDLKSKNNIPLAKPKREILAIFNHKNIKHITEGDYNQLEKSISKVRFPYKDPHNQKTYYPLIINFKIDHYFGAEYDRQITELFLKAQQYNFLSDIITIFENLLDEYEEQLEIDLLISRLERSPFKSYRTKTLQIKIESIIKYLNPEDKLEELFQKLTFIKSLDNQKKIKLDLLTTHQKHQHLINKLYQINKSITGSSTCLIIGSTANNQYTHSSDIDLIIIDPDKKPEKHIHLKHQLTKLSSIINKEIELAYYFSPKEFFQNLNNNHSFIKEMQNFITLRDDLNLETLINRNLLQLTK